MAGVAVPLTVKQAASRLGVSPSTLYQLVSARKIAHLRVGTGRGGIRFTDAQLAGYLDECSVEPIVHRSSIRCQLKHLCLPAR